MNTDTLQRDHLRTSVRSEDYMGEGGTMGVEELADYDYTANGESSEAIRAEIERTRNQMSHKIDSIQSKLNPESIKAQAQDTLRSVVEDGSNAVMNYWRENQAEIRNSVVDIVRRNPIPTALIGVGVGWALIDSFTNRNSSGNAGRQSYQEYQSNRPPGSNYAISGAYGYDNAPRGVDYSSTGNLQAGNQSWESNQPNGHKDQSNVEGSSISEKVGHVIEQVRDSASGALAQVKEEASQVAGQVRDGTSRLVDKVTAQSSQLTEQVQHRTQQYSDQMGEQMNNLSNMGTQAQYKTQQIVQTNPLVMGGAALALGAIIGLLLPGTERENEMMGDLREQVTDKAQALVGDVKQRVQQAVEEAKPEVQNMASKVVDDVKQHAQQIVDEIKPEVKNLANKVVGDTNKMVDEASKMVSDAANSQSTGQNFNKNKAAARPQDATSRGSDAATKSGANKQSDVSANTSTLPTTGSKPQTPESHTSSFAEFDDKVKEEHKPSLLEPVSPH